MIHYFFYLLARAIGWKFVCRIPDDLNSFIFLGAPHTSNHDFIPSMALVHVMARHSRFVIAGAEGKLGKSGVKAPDDSDADAPL